MLPLTAGFLIAGPLAGIWSDRLGPRPFTIGGQVTGTVAFVLLAVLPVNFQYWAFALLLLAFGLGMGAFSSSNAAEVMGAVDPAQRGSAAGIRATGLNCGQTLAISLFFTLLTAGLAARLPHALSSGLAGAECRHPGRRGGAPAPGRHAVRHLPRLQPHQVPARPGAALDARRDGQDRDQHRLLPARHLGPIPRRPAADVRFRRGLDAAGHCGLRADQAAARRSSRTGSRLRRADRRAGR